MTLVVDGNDRGSVVDARLDETIVVRVPESGASGGYRWHVDHVDDVVVETGSDYEPPPKGAPIGAAGQRMFAFKAANRGTGKIGLSSFRDWEGPAKSVDRFEVAVHVG